MGCLQAPGPAASAPADQGSLTGTCPSPRGNSLLTPLCARPAAFPEDERLPQCLARRCCQAPPRAGRDPAGSGWPLPRAGRLLHPATPAGCGPGQPPAAPATCGSARPPFPRGAQRRGAGRASPAAAGPGGRSRLRHVRAQPNPSRRPAPPAPRPLPLPLRAVS